MRFKIREKKMEYTIVAVSLGVAILHSFPLLPPTNAQSLHPPAETFLNGLREEWEQAYEANLHTNTSESDDGIAMSCEAILNSFHGCLDEERQGDGAFTLASAESGIFYQEYLVRMRL